MLGMLGTAGSVLLTGVTVETLQKAGLTALDSYRVIFLAYSGVGMLKFFLCLMLSSQVELTRSIEKSPAEEDDCSEEDQSPLLANNEDAHYSTFDPLAAAKLDGVGKLEPRQMFTSSSFSFMWRLSLAMALDFIGSGLAQVSWMVYFFKREYDVAEGPLGTAIFGAGIASSVLNLFSPPLSRRIGNVPTMVVCHTLNSITLLMVSIPNNKTLALILFILRIVTREMDNAPRQAFISAGVLEEERTSAMGVVNVVKTVGSCLGLFLTGEFAGMGEFWIAFILAGSLKLGYNVLIAAFFWNDRGNRGSKGK
jgi:Na+/melibiose symporter-like transporter